MKKQKSQELNDFIAKNSTLSYAELSKELGISVDSVRKRYRKLGLPHKRSGQISFQDVEVDIQKMINKSEDSVLKKKYKLLLEKHESLEKRHSVSLGLTHTAHKIVPTKDDKSEATAFMLASDWHTEESIDPETINGLNQYNLSIASSRADKFFSNGLKLVQMLQKELQIDHLVIPLLGDLINGHIHEELMESNELLPMDAIIFTQSLLVSGIDYILANSKVKITLVCHSGNHGRTTKDRRISTEAGHSLEFLMYAYIKSYYKGNSRVEVQVSRGYHSYMTLYDNFTLRFHHGHAIRYGGGVGGIYIPVNKAISQWNKVKHADLDVFGHFHQFRDGGNFVSNGSLCGYNAYALSIKADFEKPMQGFFLIDRKRGKTIVTKVFMD